jgi:hypothetical protein
MHCSVLSTQNINIVAKGKGGVLCLIECCETWVLLIVRCAILDGELTKLHEIPLQWNLFGPSAVSKWSVRHFGEFVSIKPDDGRKHIPRNVG